MRSGSRGILIVAVIVVLAIIAAFAFDLVSLDQTQEAALPEVQGGQLPEFDADVADVDVGTTNTTIDVPTVDVGTKEETVELPTVEVNKAE